MIKLEGVYQNDAMIGVLYVHGSRKAYIDISKGKVKNVYRQDKYFQPINDYLAATLDEDACDSLMDTFEEASKLAIHDGVFKGEEFLTEVKDILDDIINGLRVHDLEDFVQGYSALFVPELFDETGNYAPATTYTTQQYKSLLGLILILKVISPVWVSIYRILVESVGRSRRDWIIYEMLETTQIVEVPAWDRLLTYIVGNLKSSYELPSNIGIAGFTREDIPPLLMSHIICRTLAKTETTEAEVYDDSRKLRSNNIAGVIKSYLARQPENKSAEFGNQIHDVYIPGKEGNSGEEGNTSFSESLSAREDKTTSITVSIETASSRLDRVHRYIDPTLPVELVNAFHEHVVKVGAHPSRLKSMLINAILMPTMGYKADPYYSDKGWENILAVTAAFCHKWKLYDLVRWLLAREEKLDIEYISNLQYQAKNAKFSKECTDILEEIYPQTSKASAQRLGGTSKNTSIQLNPVSLINHLTDCICSKQYVELSPMELTPLDENGIPQEDNRYLMNSVWHPKSTFKDLVVLYLKIVNDYRLKVKEQHRNY